MLRIAVCDDSRSFLEQISHMIDQWHNRPANAVCYTFQNSDKLINAHSTSPFDIILLDIMMPFVNGIETAREIRQNDKTVKIVFLTSSPEFAVESYTVKASNYLLKPVDSTALYACLDEIAYELSLGSSTITVKGIYSVQKLTLDSIEYVEAQNKHIVFAMQDGTAVETTEPLHVLEANLTLADGFFRCHRSYIVNMSHIDTYTLKEIKMRSGCRIPIARSCHKEFETAYFAVVFGKAGEDR